MSDAPSDLTRELLQDAMPERAIRTYPAIMSTEAEAMSWARKGAPHGALVVAGYQASPRGRAGLEWGGLFSPGHGLGFSLVLRPRIPSEREGWLYTITLLAAADAMPDDDIRIEWPDRLVRDKDEVVVAVGVQTDPEGDAVTWGVPSVLIPAAEPPRTKVLVDILEAIDRRLAQPVEDTIAAYRDRCATLGRRVQARLLPLGPAAPTVLGEATDTAADGGLVIQEERSNAHVIVLPQALGFLEPPPTDELPPGIPR